MQKKKSRIVWITQYFFLFQLLLPVSVCVGLLYVPYCPLLGDLPHHTVQHTNHLPIFLETRHIYVGLRVGHVRLVQVLQYLLFRKNNLKTLSTQNLWLLLPICGRLEIKSVFVPSTYKRLFQLRTCMKSTRITAFLVPLTRYNK